MPVVVVNDASCLIGIRKARLLPVLCRLPFRFVVPLPIREAGLLEFRGRAYGGVQSDHKCKRPIVRAFLTESDHELRSKCGNRILARVYRGVMRAVNVHAAAAIARVGSRYQ